MPRWSSASTRWSRRFAAARTRSCWARRRSFGSGWTRARSLDNLVPEAFATVREAVRRHTGERQFDVQLIGGAVLHGGDIAEMRTGEGKTSVATLAAYLNALPGRGVHIVTVNDYLANRDANWYGGALVERLGLTVGVIQHGLAPDDRRAAYAADLTYGTNNEFGFDYLRDNMVQALDERVQRGLHYAIVDEVDNILIDEARTPLIISGAAEQSTQHYYQMAQVVRRLKEEDPLHAGPQAAHRQPHRGRYRHARAHAQRRQPL